MKQTEPGVKTPSLRRQLSTGLSLGLIVLFLSFWGVTTYSLHHLTEDYLVNRLTHDAEAIPAALQRDQYGNLAISPIGADFFTPTFRSLFYAAFG